MKPRGLALLALYEAAWALKMKQGKKIRELFKRR
jgi:hypothetical protein